MNQLPPGVSGLLIAGVFAAAMSSLDSSMNSVAAAVTADFYARFRPRTSEASRLRLARWTTVCVGVFGMASALLLAGWNIKSLWDQATAFLGLLGGSLAGLFLLGIFTRRAHANGALVGFIGSVAVQWFIKLNIPVHSFVFPITGIFSCAALGYIASWLLPGQARDLNGLTMKRDGR